MIKIIKKLVIIELVLLVASFIAAIVMDAYLPLALQEYLFSQYDKDLSTAEIILAVGILVLLIVYVASLIGLLLTKGWARKVFLFNTALIIPLCFFVDPVVMHSVSYVLDQAVVLVHGMLLSVLMFNDAYQKHTLKKSEE